MQSIGLNIYDAFTTRIFGGNIAAVVTGANGLEAPQMQIIASETGVPATVFACPASEADFTVRFFTPTREIGMCGHGLVALGTQLAAEGMLKVVKGNLANLTLQVGAQTVQMQVDLENSQPLVMINQEVPTISPCDIDHNLLCDALGMSEDKLVADIPLETAAGALDHLFVPLHNLDALAGLNPDFTKLTRLSNQVGVMTIDVFSLETDDPHITARSRDFCPAAGIAEAAGSGTTNSALFCYLIRNDCIKASDGELIRITNQQGYEMNRPAQIHCEALYRDGNIHDLKVGGRAVVSMQGSICLPPKKNSN